MTTTTDHESYHTYLGNITRRFSTFRGPLFKTDASKTLFDEYLLAFPEAERQHHNCSACRHFINRYGALVDSTGTSPVWNVEDAPEHAAPTKVLKRLAERGKITSVFLSSNRVWGFPETNVWRHLSLTPPAALRYVSPDGKTAGQAMAVKREEHAMLRRAIAEFDTPVVKAALLLLRGESLYRGAKVLPTAEWFYALKTGLEQADSRDIQDRMVWVAVATAAAGWARLRGGVLGTLLEDIKAGLPFADTKAKFDAKMRADTYGHSTAAPKAGAVAVAQALFETMGLEPALQRRYAAVSELPMEWTPAPMQTSENRSRRFGKTSASKLFSNLAPAAAPATSPAAVAAAAPGKPITWEKFVRDVLPLAQALEVKVPTDTASFAALVTGPDEPRLLQWSNPFSWYYHSGMEGEFKRRVEQAGGQYVDVAIRATLLWNNRNDLDISVVTPGRQRIYYGMKRDSTGGWLDVDMNVQGETTKPVENIRWAKGTPPAGQYRVEVWNYNDRCREDTPYTMELEVDGKTYHVQGVAPRGETGVWHPIAVFEVEHGGRLVREPRLQGHANARTATAAPIIGDNGWGLVAGAYVPVTGIVASPNLWGDSPLPHHGRHAFLLLQGCADTTEGKGRGFFTETLRSELHPVRAVLEAHAKQATIDPTATGAPPACGIGISEATPRPVLVRVDGGMQYSIDRWE